MTSINLPATALKSNTVTGYLGRAAFMASAVTFTVLWFAFDVGAHAERQYHPGENGS
jgi:hypothetical protein